MLRRSAVLFQVIGGARAMTILASPKTLDPLFRTIEDVHDKHGKAWGHILDSGTGGHSLKWLATLPDVTKITAVSADTSSGEGKGALELRSLLKTERGDAIVEGAWCASKDPAGVDEADTIICDYLIGSMDGFTPYEQDRVIGDALLPRLKPGGMIHIVGLNPVYSLLGESGYAKLTEAEKIVVDTARARDSAILMAKHRPYREFPAAWIIRQLEKNGLKVVLPWKSFGVIWKQATIKKQLDVARRKLPFFDDEALRAAMAAKLDALEADAKRVIPAEGIIYSHDYVISAIKAA